MSKLPSVLDETQHRQDAFAESRPLLALRLRVEDGPDAGKTRILKARYNLIGSGEGCHVTLSDPTVSKSHLEIHLQPEGFVLQDLQSRNGSWAGQLRIERVYCQQMIKLRLGATSVVLEPAGQAEAPALSQHDRFGGLLGHSVVMRELFAQLREAAPHTTTILLEGETGTGKELLARAIHDHSPRRERPYVVLDASVLPPTLAARELFGHAKGAYTDAQGSQIGIFEKANGGTLFIDEIGELPLELQPLLLRVLEYGEIKPLGSNETRKVDVRVVCATNRNLRREVNDGRFRADLFFRISAIQVQVPPLRERREDVPLLAAHFLKEVGELCDNALDDTRIAAILKPHADKLLSYEWPGNVRELRNKMEKLYIKMVDAGELVDSLTLDSVGRQETGFEVLCKKMVLRGMALRDAKQEAVDGFERTFLICLLEKTGGNISEAARLCEQDRRNFQKLVRKYGL